MSNKNKNDGEEFVEFKLSSAEDIKRADNIKRADKAEEMAAAQANARHRLTERIKRWNTRTLENVGGDIKTTFSLTPAGRLENKAFALLDEYHALVVALEELFADCYRYTDEEEVTKYVYIYPTEQLWMGRPKNKPVLYQIMKVTADAYTAAKEAGDRTKTDELLRANRSIYWRYGDFHRGWKYHGPDTFQILQGENSPTFRLITSKLPPSAVPCPEPRHPLLATQYQNQNVAVASGEDTSDRCAIQGGGKKSKSKYSRKTKSRYSRKSKSKYLRKSKSKYLRKSKSKLKSKYSRKY